MRKDSKLPSIERIVFISQYLLSIQISLKQSKNFYEQQLQGHSIDFYTNFKLLEDLKLIKR